MYANKSLTPCKRRLSQTNREAMALVWSCERFAMYLIGRKFELYTDHKPLEVIFGPRYRPSRRLEGFMVRIQAFNFEIKVIKGTQMVADVFSRLCDGTIDTSVDSEEEQLLK